MTHKTRRTTPRHKHVLLWVELSRLPVVGASQTYVRYFRDEMTARNKYVINKLGWDRRAFQNVPSTLRDYNSTGSRKYDFPENVSAIMQPRLRVSRFGDFLLFRIPNYEYKVDE